MDGQGIGSVSDAKKVKKVKKTFSITASVAVQVETVSAATGIDQSRIVEDGIRLILKQREDDLAALELARAAALKAR
jgi:hypothetical protein